MTWTEIVKKGYNQFLKHHEDLEYVIRCKDCKHRDHYECNNIMLGGTKCGVTDDWFCADGERKETEDGRNS